MELYNLPFFQKSSLKWYVTLLYSFTFLIFLVLSFFSFRVIIEDNLIFGICIGLMMILLSIFTGYIILYAAVLKKFSIELTKEYIRVRIPFKKIEASFKDISETHLYKYQSNTMLAILLNRDINIKKKKTMSNSFNRLLGFPSISFQIPLNYFSKIDAQRLLYTIDEQVVKNSIRDELSSEDIKENEDKNNSLLKALLASISVSILFSLIYAFILFKVEKNYVVIPIFGSLLIISAFNKYYLERTFSISIRALVGLICLIQVPLGIIASVIMTSSEVGLRITYNNLSNIIKGIANELIHSPSGLITISIVSIICFLTGSIRGRMSKKLLKNSNAKALFIKKTIGIDIFNEELTICGYDFPEKDYYEIEQAFSKLKGINLTNIYDYSLELKRFFRLIAKSMGFGFLKPKLFLIIPDNEINNWESCRQQISKIILASGWSTLYFVEEVMTAAIGSNLPYNKIKSDNLYSKIIIVYCKKNAVVFCVALAGGIFMKKVIPSSLLNIEQTEIDNIFNEFVSKEIPKSLLDKHYSLDIKKQLYDSWKTDIERKIYLLAPEQEKNEFIRNSKDFVVEAPDGYEQFIKKGLEHLVQVEL